MTDKEQIIIDGVDVSSCKGLKYKPGGIKKPICFGGGIRGIYRSCLCEKNQNCHFKQHARKTQECELAEQLIAGILKTLNLEAYDWRADQNEIITEIKTFIEKYEALKLENQEGYEIVDELKQECDLYRKALEEIEEYCNDYCMDDCIGDERLRTFDKCQQCISGDILDIINKAKEGNNENT